MLIQTSFPYFLHTHAQNTMQLHFYYYHLQDIYHGFYYVRTPTVQTCERWWADGFDGFEEGREMEGLTVRSLSSWYILSLSLTGRLRKFCIAFRLASNDCDAMYGSSSLRRISDSRPFKTRTTSTLSVSQRGSVSVKHEIGFGTVGQKRRKVIKVI